MLLTINKKEIEIGKDGIQELIDLLETTRGNNAKVIKKQDIKLSEQSKLLSKMEGKLKNYQDEIQTLKGALNET